MPSTHGREHWTVSKQDHPGSSADEIEQEPDWGSTGHEHHVGYKNRQGRRTGVTHVGDDHDHDHDHMEVQEAWEEFQATKRKAQNGGLVNFRDAIKNEKDLSLQHPENRPLGWRYVLDYTEDGIKKQQGWPANFKAHEPEGKKRGQEKKDGQEREKSQDKPKERQQNQQPDHRQGDQQDEQRDEQQTDNRSEEERLRDKYNPQELAFLRALEHERNHLASLKVNDGTGHSNVKNRTMISIDEADQFTPDNWIPRSPELIRLSGKHPLNAEVQMTRLFECGFITPNELHYVRTHGAVPRLLWEFHQLEIECFGKQTKFSMNDIKRNFRSINIPVFMACDNGRRKELNLLKRTKGFNWGPGAVGCAYWKGPLMRDVLMAAGVPEHFPDADTQRYWVHLRGADNPGAAQYETSIPFEYMMDPRNDVLLAYEMNDVPLPPDHGYPIRVVIPGYVGGRQVKWLEKAWIDTKENDSYYHIWDNRTLPSFVTTTDDELAMTMFHHTDTALYEQSLQSLIARPAQGETLELKDVKGQEYRIQGFAYNGRGDEIKKVEVSLDEGKTWYYCIRTFPEAPIRHGTKFWTWCFWHVDVDIGALLDAPAITVRAWDVKMLTQPEKPVWNILGSMNNAQYTVKGEIVNEKKSPYVFFRHPVEPANGEGGWMKQSAENQIADASKKTDAPNKRFTRAEIEKHDNENDCWIVVNNRVYDATSVLAWHPGGAGAIMPHAGRCHAETTDEFSSIHDDYAYGKLNECILGVVTDKAAKYIAQTAKKDDPSKRVPSDQALQKHRWVPARLMERNKITGDTSVYKFELPDKADYLGIGTCQHIEFGFHLRDRMLIRPYTPTKPVLPRDSGVQPGDDKTLHDGHGTFELTIKTYYPTDEQPGGALSNIMDAMSIGEAVEMRGPAGDVVYKGLGTFSIYGEEKKFKRVSLLVGGSGLTPGFSLIARVSLTPEDKTELRVIDANKTEDDILLREDLDRYESMSNGKVKVTHVLSHATDEWKGLRGHVNKEIMQKHLFPPSEENVTLLCGPPAMIEKAVLPVLEEWGYSHNENMFGL